MKQKNIEELCYVIGTLEFCYSKLELITIKESIEKLQRIVDEEGKDENRFN